MRISDWSSDVCSSDLNSLQVFERDDVDVVAEPRLEDEERFIELHSVESRDGGIVVCAEMSDGIDREEINRRHKERGGVHEGKRGDGEAAAGEGDTDWTGIEMDGPLGSARHSVPVLR